VPWVNYCPYPLLLQGKPHPGVYITAAKLLGVPPTRCLAIEDSVNGTLSAKAARMSVVVVPELKPGAVPRQQFGIADVVLRSLEHFDELAFHAACALG
jgi:sugar-phosphatase